MRTQRTAYYDPKKDQVWHGLKVMVAGAWYRYAEDGIAVLFRSEKEADSKRAELRRKPEFKLPKKRSKP